MTDLSPRRTARATSRAAQARVTELHDLCRQDYAKGTRQRLSAQYPAAFLAMSPDLPPATEPSDLTVAIRVAQQLLDSDSVLSMREALRLLLRALGAESEVRP